jgi:phosphoglycolate phosphatase
MTKSASEISLARDVANSLHQWVIAHFHNYYSYQGSTMKANIVPGQIKAILFDKDGTLINMTETWVPTFKAAAAELERRVGTPGMADRVLADTGFEHAQNRIHPESALAMYGNREVLEMWLGPNGDTDLIDPMLDYIADTAIQHTQPLFELSPYFEALEAKNYGLGIATMDAEVVARFTAEKFGLLSHLDFIAGYDSGHGEKPGPGMIDAFCRQLDLAPEEIAMVGDTNHDLAMGRNAGAGLVVGVLSGGNPREQLTDLADIILDDARDLLELLPDA